MTTPARDASTRLDSWKAIADHFCRTVRTVQRWERSFGLPVHRHAHHSAASIYAFRDELDTWFTSRRQQLGTSADDWGPDAPAQAGQPPQRSHRQVLVSPFADLSADASQGPLCDGLVDELTCMLAGVHDLSVVAPPSRRTGIDEARTPLPAAATGADILIEGSVRVRANRLRVTVRVMDQVHGRIMAAFHLDGTQAQGAALQELLARRVLFVLQRPHSQLAAEALAPDVTAYERFLASRQAWAERTPDRLRDSILLAAQAIERDPDDALAYAALASAEVTLSSYAFEPPQLGMDRARLAATRALAIESDLPEAWTAHGAVRVLYDWDPDAAAVDFQRAFALMPQNATLWQWCSLVALARGQLAQAVSTASQAESLDPGSAILPAHVAWLLYLSRRYDDALEACARALRFEPGFARALANASWVYTQLGRTEEAVRAMEQCVSLTEAPTYRAMLAGAQAAAGQRTLARRTLDDLRAGGRYASGYFLALAMMALGERAEALALLQLALERREWFLLMLRFEPLFDPLRNHPDFVAVLAAVGPQPAPPVRAGVR